MSSQSPRPPNRPRVLIVDDQVANIEVLGASLEQDHDISFATSGSEALALAGRLAPDLILLDVMMPGMDGYETCRQLRDNAALKDLPVIFLSALDDVPAKLRAFRAGGNDYVTKPFQAEEVRARVNTQVALYQARRELGAREDRLRQNLAELEAAHAQLKQMSGQLVQSEKMAAIGQLAAGVAHEINNPIGFVSSNLGTLKHYVASLLQLVDQCSTLAASATPAARQALQEAERAVDLDYLREDVVKLIDVSIAGASRVRRIVQDLRDFAHPGDAQWQEADLQAGLESTLNVAWNELKYKAEVVREYSPVPWVPCQISQINQVFLNLLVNAAQAIAERGRITVRTRCEGQGVAVDIADTGSGIAPEHLEKVFDPFFTTKPVGKGTGLGLALSYGIVSQHGGRISVQSELGQGSTFTVWLPLQPPPAPPAAQPSPAF